MAQPLGREPGKVPPEVQAVPEVQLLEPEQERAVLVEQAVQVLLAAQAEHRSPADARR